MRTCVKNTVVRIVINCQEFLMPAHAAWADDAPTYWQHLPGKTVGWLEKQVKMQKKREKMP